MEPSPPSRLLAETLTSLHRAHLARRGLELLAWALLLDAGVDILSLGVQYLFRFPLHLPGISLAVLLLLLATEAARSPLPAFAARVDRRFALKERLRSALWYRSSPAVAAEVREAQAAEVLRAVDFPLLRRELGPRIPPLLLLSLPLFLGMVAFTLNSGFVAPGALTRLTVATLERGGGRALVGGGNTEAPLSAADAPGEMPTLVFFSPQRTDRPGEGAEGTAAGEGGGEDGEGASEEAMLATGKARGKVTESFPVSGAVSPPVPRVLTAEPSLLPLEGPGGRMLDLFPLAAAPAGVVFGTGATVLPGVDLSLYPARYRPQIAAYFKELMEWSRRP